MISFLFQRPGNKILVCETIVFNDIGYYNKAIYDIAMKELVVFYWM